MARTSTTRSKGNGPGKGPGIGGPAKGMPPRGERSTFQPGNKMRDLPPNERRAARVEAAWRVREEALEHEDWRARAYAADSILGKAMQAIEMSGVDGDPIKHDGTMTIVFKRPSAGD